MLLIDSSALVKFFSKEPGWEAVTQYIEEALTLSFALLECSNALLNKVKSREMDMATARELVENYAEVAILIDQNNYLDTALNIASENGLAVYDSLFVAAALGQDYTLVSCDKKQLKVAKALNVSSISC